MNGFFGLMLNNQNTQDIYFGLPDALRPLVQYRFNSKDTQNFNLRNDGGNNYVVDYQDPISSKTVAQVLTSKHPLFDENGVFFQSDDYLILEAAGFVPREVWIVANCDDGATFTDYRTFFMIRPLTGSFDTLYCGNIGSTNMFASPPNTRINNALSTNFSPLVAPKTISGEHAAVSYTDHVVYIGGTGGVGGIAGLNGRIKDIICFNTVLDGSQKADIYNYLTTFHAL